jgi:hypothetical protein
MMGRYHLVARLNRLTIGWPRRPYSWEGSMKTDKLLEQQNTRAQNWAQHASIC